MTNDTNTKRSKRRGPGKVLGNSATLLHTRQGMILFDGRPADPDRGKAAIYGVPRFYGAVKQIYFDAQADDPWADWWLVKIDDALEKAQTRLDELRQEIQRYYPDNKSVQIKGAHSVDPESRPLDFAVPSYPHRAAYLVVDCDLLILEVMNLFHVGLITRLEKERYLNLIGKVARSTLQSVTGYRHQGVTRNDVAANNPRARKARELMGEVPEDILELRRRSPYAPELRQYTTVESDHAGSEAGSLKEMPKVAEG